MHSLFVRFWIGGHFFLTFNSLVRINLIDVFWEILLSEVMEKNDTFWSSTTIPNSWQLSEGSHVSHTGTVLCRPRGILTDVSQRFVYAGVWQVLSSSGDQCLSCSLSDLMFICWWSITALTARGLVLPSPLTQSGHFDWTQRTGNN